MKTYRIVLSGRVQGVGYRYYVQDRAQVLGIRGFAKNTDDYKVEVVCQGEQEKLENFIPLIKKGPAFSRVTEFFMEEVENPPIFDSFMIKY